MNPHASVDSPATHRRTWILALLAVAGLVGCQSSVGKHVAAGEYGKARVALSADVSASAKDRNYILDRMRVLTVSLADGKPQLAEPIGDEMYTLLTTANLNEDGTIKTIFGSEEMAIRWKGEPFEQAYAYCYVAIQRAMTGRWDDSMVAAKESLFNLQDFGANEKGERRSTVEIAAGARQREIAAKDERLQRDEYFTVGYQPVDTNFTLGYLLTGLAAKQIGRDDEAKANFNRAVALKPSLEPVADAIGADETNTIFVVDFGLGPKKVRYGPDGAFARFEPRTRSANGALQVSIDGGPPVAVPVACDVNELAIDHFWNNMEDVRRAKSIVGNVLIYGGIGAAAAGGDSQGAGIAALVLIIAGIIVKLTAGADTRFCEMLPQRTYIVPASIVTKGSIVEFMLDDASGARLVLAGIDPPARAGEVQLKYVRWVDLPALKDGSIPWTVSGDVLYASDSFAGEVPGDELPWILGGRCVRTPTQATLDLYQAKGQLRDYDVDRLREIYAAEGIVWDPQDLLGRHTTGGRGASPATGRLHVLEGGDSLIAPVSGTVGFQRLFGREYPPYNPRSALLIEERSRISEAALPAGALVTLWPQ